ncbi:MAG: YbhN family protein [Actinomycetota bacterium]
MAAVDTAPPPERKPPMTRRKKIIRAIQILVSLGIVAGIFVGILPKIADYSAVWKTITSLTPLELGSLLLVTVLNILTYWPQMVASMPGLTFWQAGVNNQSSTTIANTMPLGGALATGVSYTMYRSWGFRNSEIVLSALITGVWNTFIKLALPVIALAALIATGQTTASLLIPTIIGIGVLGAAVVLFGMILHSRALARRVGSRLGKVVSFVRKLLRKPPVDWSDAAVRFRHQTIELIAKRWAALSASTVVSHVCLYLVLLLALRHVGVADHEISWAQVLGVFAFVRLISALPLTPGGVGLVELGYIGALYTAGKNRTNVPLDVFKVQITAAVLLFRALTYGAQIPLGALTYVFWRAKKSWRKPVPHEPPEPQSAAAPGLEPVPRAST